MTIPTSAKSVAFIVTRDREAAKRFYGGTLGFTLSHEDDFAVVYDMNGTMLRISTMPDHVAQGHTVLGWDVPDIVAAATALRAKGVAFGVQVALCDRGRAGRHELGRRRHQTAGRRVRGGVRRDGEPRSRTGLVQRRVDRDVGGHRVLGRLRLRRTAASQPISIVNLVKGF